MSTTTDQKKHKPGLTAQDVRKLEDMYSDRDLTTNESDYIEANEKIKNFIHGKAVSAGKDPSKSWGYDPDSELFFELAN